MKNEIKTLLNELFSNYPIIVKDNTIIMELEDFDKIINIDYVEQKLTILEAEVLDNGKKCWFKQQSKFRELSNLKYSLNFFKKYTLGMEE